jgi:hypothetical protein
MAQATGKDIVLNRVKLCINPTDLSTAFPHGGTAIGEVRDLVFRSQVVHHESKAEEFGQETVEYVTAGQRAIVAGVARGFDNDMVSKIYINSAEGTTTQDQRVAYPGSGAKKAGRKRSDDSVVLVASPEDTEHGVAVILFKALPLLDATAALNMHRTEEMGTAFLFAGIRNTNGKVYQLGRLADLDLS